MSAVAVQFDPRFELGLSRSSFAWPAMESASDFLGGDGLPPLEPESSDSSFTPPSISRSITSSPPRPSLTPQQRELKRQRDQARRDSKMSMRARAHRAMSGSYGSQSPDPNVSEFSAAPTLPVYTTTAPEMTILNEPVTTMPGPNYIPSYASPLPDHGSAMFPTQYSQSLPSSSYMPLDYSTGFPPTSSAPPVGGHYGGRSASLPEPSLMYPVAPVVPSGVNSNQDGGHVRVVQSRPKPQCWEHGCNGRQFSTFSNLLRHQREKSGQAAKASCPNCGAEFTRTTARNGHLLHDKCKQRRNS